MPEIRALSETADDESKWKTLCPMCARVYVCVCGKREEIAFCRTASKKVLKFTTPSQQKRFSFRDRKTRLDFRDRDVSYVSSSNSIYEMSRTIRTYWIQIFNRFLDKKNLISKFKERKRRKKINCCLALL